MDVWRILALLGCAYAVGHHVWAWRQRHPKTPELGEVIQVHIDQGLPHVPDSMWQAIEDTFLMFDQRIYDEELEYRYWVGDMRAAVDYLANPPELFVPKIAYFGPEVVREMEFCHAAGSTVVHHKDCSRAPSEERRRWIWAFSAEDAADWAADEPGYWRPCGICKPYVRAVGDASAELQPSGAAEEAGDAVRVDG